MIRHQNPKVHAHTMGGNGVVEVFKEAETVGVGAEDLLPSVAARHCVVDGARVLHAQGSGHQASVAWGVGERGELPPWGLWVVPAGWRGPMIWSPCHLSLAANRESGGGHGARSVTAGTAQRMTAFRKLGRSTAVWLQGAAQRAGKWMRAEARELLSRSLGSIRRMLAICHRWVVDFNIFIYGLTPKSAKAILGASLIAFSSFLPNKADADIIRVDSNSGGQNPYLSGTEGRIANEPGGKLGWDSGDSYWKNSSDDGFPPGTPPILLAPYSDQVNRYNGFTNREQIVDNRPFDGPDKNKEFPLFLSILRRPGAPTDGVTSPNNRVYFEIVYRDSGDDEQGRRYYYWEMTLFPSTNLVQGSVVWADGSTNLTKSGIWDTHESGRHYLPYYHLINVKGARPRPIGEFTFEDYASLRVIPYNPSQSTNYQWAIQHKNANGSELETTIKQLAESLTIPGTTNWPAGSTGTNTISEILIYDPNNSGRRFKYKNHQTTQGGN